MSKPMIAVQASIPDGVQLSNAESGRKYLLAVVDEDGSVIAKGKEVSDNITVALLHAFERFFSADSKPASIH